MGRHHAVSEPNPVSGKKYPFDEMEVGDYMAFGSYLDASRAVGAGNSHACKPRTQGRKYSQKRQPQGWFKVTRIA